MQSLTGGGGLDASATSSAASGNTGGQLGGNVVFGNSSVKDAMLAGFFGPPSYDRYATPASTMLPQQVRVPGVGAVSGFGVAVILAVLGVIGLGFFTRKKRG